ncbi:hypothetical protein SAMN02927900_05878 [Rhizobium mongolense subsp. loessense]|uniref:Uncharacterized protein n=1 Tax=Rhizobium mongolense subsp. loessense TaxID=158890 RepID=A0A1G4TZL2_9HYPH|nr:hypothetical protein SAMN02927900_05878 [Rhizobium mongolense subsp. loessense]
MIADMSVIPSATGWNSWNAADREDKRNDRTANLEALEETKDADG